MTDLTPEQVTKRDAMIEHIEELYLVALREFGGYRTEAVFTKCLDGFLSGKHGKEGMDSAAQAFVSLAATFNAYANESAREEVYEILKHRFIVDGMR